MTEKSGNPSAWYLLKATFTEWTEDNAAHHAAALAFYTLFSLAPLLVIAVAIAGLFVGQEAIQDQVIGWVQQYIRSQEVAELLRNVLDNVSTLRQSILATVLSLFGLFFGATAIFSELRTTLNFIWDVPGENQGGVGDFIRNRLLALVMVLGSGLVLLSSLLLNVILSVAADWIRLLPFGWSGLSPFISFLFFFILTTLIFALIYRFVPERSIAWDDVWIGALATALLFSVGRYLISLYMGYSTVASTYGAAGSLAILLVWTYYSAQVFFLGAEFTQVYARTYGTRWGEHELLDEEPDEGDAIRGKMEKPPPRKMTVRPRRSLVRSTADLAVAFGVISVVSVVSLLREPFRR
ncbi:MAG TPA: YihY/virulence factor BrkB family protein [Caldilineaceae bacterium]|nr:YihY/virulence factor BrkB family protein [Caldilineaceae bacterium]